MWAEIKTQNIFFPLQIVVKDPFLEHRERQDAHRYTLAT